MAEQSSPALLVFADDWGRHPSSCQHLVRQLVGRYETVWVNTIGTRLPRLDWATVRRALEKAGHWLSRKGGGPVVPAGPRVVSPWMWPSFRSTFARKLNRGLLARQLTPLLRALNRPVVAITTLPLAADLIGVLPVTRWVYYCVDDFALWPGLDHSTLRTMESRLIRDADVLIAVSDTLRDKLAARGREVHLLTHGVDLDLWSGTGPCQEFAELEGVERPLIVFWGLLDRRMDADFLRRLAADLTRGTILLVGPESDPDPSLPTLPRTRRLAPLTYERLPQLAREADVLIMPYADLPVTRAMQPLKLKEYLLTGKPVVARDLPANREWRDCLDLVCTPAEFSEAVRSRLTTGLPEEQRVARSRLSAEGWPAKARLLEQWSLQTESIRPAEPCPL